MPSSVVSFSTSGLPARQKTQYWTEALGELCGHLHADPFGAPTLDGHIDYTTLAGLKLCQIEASRHRVSLPRCCARDGEHPVIKILFQTCGASVFQQDGHRLDIEPGDCLAYDVSRPHIITSETLTKHDVVIIPKAVLQERGYAGAGIRAQRLSARSGPARFAHDFLDEAFDEAAKVSGARQISLADALLDRVLLPFVTAGAQGFHRTGSERLRARAKSFIHENLGDPDLNLERIAAALGCTKRYLHMLFREDGLTISRFIWQLRLETCRRVLCDTDLEVTEVAYSQGFSSSSHFSRLFKETYGLTPSALRMQARSASRAQP